MPPAAALAAAALLVLYAVVWTLCLIGWRTARARYNQPLPPASFVTLDSAPGVTIIRPLCGLDTNLYNALESTMRIDYPKFEVLFTVQDDDDEAVPVVRMLMAKYPQVNARIIIDPRNVGVNPKVNNLLGAFEQAQYDFLWVVDATISSLPGILGRTVDAFVGPRGDIEAAEPISDGKRTPPTRGDVGLVHHVPLAVAHQKTWGSLIEQAFLNTTHAKMYLAINALALDSCVMGKSNMYSKSNIASLSTPSPSLRSLPSPPHGLAGFAPFLAEDNMIGLSLWHELGLRHAMTADVALDFLGALSIHDYVQRRVRWIRVRKRMTPPIVVALEPFTESILCGICGAWALHRLFNVSRPLVFALHLGLWLVIDLQVCKALERNITRTKMSVTAWAMREVLALPIWVYGICGSEIVWRGRRYRVLRSGEASVVH